MIWDGIVLHNFKSLYVGFGAKVVQILMKSMSSFSRGVCDYTYLTIRINMEHWYTNVQIAFFTQRTQQLLQLDSNYDLDAGCLDMGKKKLRTRLLLCTDAVDN